jgi:hypothetical protein
MLAAHLTGPVGRVAIMANPISAAISQIQQLLVADNDFIFRQIEFCTLQNYYYTFSNDHCRLLLSTFNVSLIKPLRGRQKKSPNKKREVRDDHFGLSPAARLGFYGTYVLRQFSSCNSKIR